MILDVILEALVPDGNSPRWYQWLWIIAGASILIVVILVIAAS